LPYRLKSRRRIVVQSERGYRLRGRERRKGRLRKELNFSARNRRQKKLQPPKKLYNYPKEVRE
jgi:hypothetical protein